MVSLIVSPFLFVLDLLDLFDLIDSLVWVLARSRGEVSFAGNALFPKSSFVNVSSNFKSVTQIFKF